MLDNLLTRIVSWAEREDPIRALILEGSRALEPRADELADFDVNLFIIAPELYTQGDGWISSLGDVWLYVPDKVTSRGKVFASRLAIYDPGVKVDFILYSTEVLRRIARSRSLPEQYDLGYRVLLDKDGATAGMPLPSGRAFCHGKPTEAAFRRCVREFWFEIHHVAKYLAREDLWSVKARDWAAKSQLLRMMAWHERGRHGWSHRTHPEGKDLRAWVAPETWETLFGAFAPFDANDGWDALFVTCELFVRLARETAESLGCGYPAEVEQSLMAFATKLRKRALTPSARTHRAARLRR